MRTSYDLSRLKWRLSGIAPFLWQLPRTMELGLLPDTETGPVPASVPGSVQAALRAAGLLPDWETGLNARLCEWVENRHWIYEVQLPDSWLPPAGEPVRLHCGGLDHAGWVRVNGRLAGTFRNAFVPHTFDLAPHLQAEGNLLQVIFDCPPRWMGQFGHTSKMCDWKPRYNYSWDWIPRLVQIGFAGPVRLETGSGPALDHCRATAGFDPASATGSLNWQVGTVGAGQFRLVLRRGDRVIREERRPAGPDCRLEWAGLPVEPWQPNGLGNAELYEAEATLLDAGGQVLDERRYRVGFRQALWRACQAAPPAADPWLCVVNGIPLFLQGVNWTPIRANAADVGDEEYRRRLSLYRELGCNLLRVWGGAGAERPRFYELCDEYGLLVWQEFPLSSSGVENWPPDSPAAMAELAAVARSYVERLRHHACLLLWCGGNELQKDPDGNPTGGGRPVGLEHPLLAGFKRIVEELDPGRRFLPTSPTGPRFDARAEEFGLGLHWEVHGPWRCDGDPDAAAWRGYWDGDDSLFRGEIGCAGASSADLIRRYAGGLPVMPASVDNPLWRRFGWWIQWPDFVAALGHEPASLEELVDWSQDRQCRALVVAASACKRRFPRCGGFLVWMGHDAFPCTANTAIVDFDGNPKPAALGLAEVFRAAAGEP